MKTIPFKKVLILIIALSLSVAGFIFYYSSFGITMVEVKRPSKIASDLVFDQNENNETTKEQGIDLRVETIPSEKEKITEDMDVHPNPLPEKFLLDVPFTSQSPYAKWDERDEESCEEASIVMVHYFWQKKVLTKELMRYELDALINFQIKHYGNYKDSNAEGIAKLAKEYYHYQAKVSYDISIADLKREIAAGNPVIVPCAGRLLHNPYFTLPGPLYHNLVLIGYNEKGFITNDPGTRRGEHYFYSTDVLYNAIHDFPGTKENIEQGRKAMVVIQ